MATKIMKTIVDLEFLAHLEKGKYKVHGLIGEGAVGKILLASILPFQNTTDREYKLEESNVIVLKLIQLHNSSNRSAFQKEVYFSQLLKHPQILRFNEAYTFKYAKKNIESQFGVISTTKMDIDLMDYILERGPLPEHTAKNVFRKLCLAIEHCHSKSVAHLDIKPDNILLSLSSTDDSSRYCEHSISNPYQVDRDEEQISACSNQLEIADVKVCDFGFAAEWTSSCEIYSKVGTKEYRAPEAFFSDKKYISTKSISLEKMDVWSLGVTLFVILTTCFPFTFSKKNGSFFRIPYSYVYQYVTDLTVIDLLQSIFEKNPKKRPSVSQILAHPWLNNRT